MLTQLLIDPPEGWKYGFPKPVPSSFKSTQSFHKWMLEQGYPQKMIDQGYLHYCRYITHKAELEKE